MIRVVFLVESLMLTCIQAKGQNTTSFHTIGYGYQKPRVETKAPESDTLDIEDYVEEGSVCVPPAESMKAYLPMVAFPLKNIIVTSAFGMRRDPMNRKKYRYHSGMDLRARYENVFSMLPGTVTAASYSKTGGNYITIDYGACSCSYLHLSKIKVRVGEHVSAGQVIGVTGNSGSRTTGPHLHLSARINAPERKYFNPMILLGFIRDQLSNCQTSK